MSRVPGAADAKAEVVSSVPSFAFAWTASGSLATASTRALSLGVRAIDALCTVTEGQRLGLFAGSGVGKSSLLGQIARSASRVRGRADHPPWYRGQRLAGTVSPEYTFEWDVEKARENLDKHGVSFEQAAGVFADPLAVSIFDDEHSSTAEDRWVTLGKAAEDLLVVVHMFQEVSPAEATVRIISARRPTRREQRDYEEGT